MAKTLLYGCLESEIGRMKGEKPYVYADDSRSV
jgi:hypothetical protein